MNFYLNKTLSLLCFSLWISCPLIAGTSDDEAGSTSPPRKKHQVVAKEDQRFIPPAPSKRPFSKPLEGIQFEELLENAGISLGVYREVYQCVQAHTKNLEGPMDLAAFLENFPKAVTLPQEPLRGEARQQHFEQWAMQNHRIKLRTSYVIWTAHICDLFGLTLQERGHVVKVLFGLEPPKGNFRLEDLCAVDIIELLYPEKFPEHLRCFKSNS